MDNKIEFANDCTFVYGIFDRKTQHFQSIYSSANVPEVESAFFLRSVSYVHKLGIDAKDASMIALYPQDFELLCLLVIDNVSGKLLEDNCNDCPFVIAFGSDVIDFPSDNEE